MFQTGVFAGAFQTGQFSIAPVVEFNRVVASAPRRLKRPKPQPEIHPDADKLEIASVIRATRQAEEATPALAEAPAQTSKFTSVAEVFTPAATPNTAAPAAAKPEKARVDVPPKSYDVELLLLMSV